MGDNIRVFSARSNVAVGGFLGFGLIAALLVFFAGSEDLRTGHLHGRGSAILNLLPVELRVGFFVALGILLTGAAVWSLRVAVSPALVRIGDEGIEAVNWFGRRHGRWVDLERVVGSTGRWGKHCTFYFLPSGAAGGKSERVVCLGQYGIDPDSIVREAELRIARVRAGAAA